MWWLFLLVFGELPLSISSDLYQLFIGTLKFGMGGIESLCMGALNLKGHVCKRMREGLTILLDRMHRCGKEGRGASLKGAGAGGVGARVSSITSYSLISCPLRCCGAWPSVLAVYAADPPRVPAARLFLQADAQVVGGGLTGTQHKQST